VVVGLVAGGLLWWAGAGWPGDDGGEEPRSGSASDGRPVLGIDAEGKSLEDITKPLTAAPAEPAAAPLPAGG